MTLIAWQNGQPVLKNGLVATGQACCCGKCSGPCTTSDDCSTGCDCIEGKCVSCSGPCTVETIGDDCDTPCGCVDGQCVKCACGDCDAAVKLVVDGLDADSFCLGGTYYGTGNGIEPAPGGCNSCETCEPFNSHGSNTAIMVCEADPASRRGIRYRVTATNIFEYSAFAGCVKSCTVVWEGFVGADEQCLPVAGNVTLTEISRENINGGCSYLQPITVSVERA